ncbi:MAG: DNA polymerase III subunit delta' [Chitinophagales bacterium]|nr:DNA polymerase III subunit delta' [Hyphomicrobiales bacterium]
MARASKTAEKDAGDQHPKDADQLAGQLAARENPNLFGHEAAESLFLAAFESGRFHHAWLMTGEPGIGKATFAYRMARRILAGGDGEQSVNDPASTVFRQVATLAHPGLFAVRRPWQPQTGKFAALIPVEEVRRLKHFFETTSATPWRIAIIDRADDLNVSSANALLKLLEEPPPRSLFLLVSAAPARLPQTIRSRCRRLPLRPLSPESNRLVVLAALDGGKPKFAPEDIDAALAASQGNPRRALEALDGAVQTLEKAVTELLNQLPALDHQTLWSLVDKASGAQGGMSEQVLDIVERRLTQIIGETASGVAPAPDAFAKARRLFSRGNLALWTGLWETFERTRADAERLNLDRAALVINIFAQMQSVAHAAQQTNTKTL